MRKSSGGWRSSITTTCNSSSSSRKSTSFQQADFDDTNANSLGSRARAEHDTNASWPAQQWWAWASSDSPTNRDRRAHGEFVRPTSGLNRPKPCRARRYCARRHRVSACAAPANGTEVYRGAETHVRAALTNPALGNAQDQAGISDTIGPSVPMAEKR